MTIESNICAGVCVLSAYFVSNIFVTFTNQTPCFEFCFTTTISLTVAFVVVALNPLSIC